MIKRPKPIEETREVIQRGSGEPGWDRVSLSAGISQHTTFGISRDFRTKRGEEATKLGLQSVILDSECLKSDYGVSLCREVLNAAVWENEGFFSKEQIERLRGDIEPDEDFRLHMACGEVLSLKESDKKQEIIVTDIWVDLYSERLSPEWIATKALVEFMVHENPYGFGYLVCELEQKLRNEANATRGKKILDAAAAGGKSRGGSMAERNREIMSRMKALIEHRKLSAARAGQIVFDLGLGTSGDANRKLWMRQKR